MLIGYISALAVGISLGLIGAGGSILTVPIFVYLMGIPPELATGYSLFVVGAAATWGAWQSHNARQVDTKIGILFAIPSFIGVYWSRSYLLPRIPLESTLIDTIIVTRDMIIMIVFALVMLAAAISMIRPTKPYRTPTQSKTYRRIALITTEGFLVGAITGFVGAGGGFLTIPALVILLGMEMKTAVGTSLMIIAIKSLFGFFSTTQNIIALDWTMLGIFTGMSAVGIILGGRLSKTISGDTLKPSFGWFVLIMGSYILLREFTG